MALEVHVVTPDQEVWSGAATMVVARGTDGEVGIMPGHSPLLVRLAVGPLRIDRDGTWESFEVAGGFLHVTSTGGTTRVDVLATGVTVAGASGAGALAPDAR